jgi:hypothetical protein
MELAISEAGRLTCTMAKVQKSFPTGPHSKEILSKDKGKGMENSNLPTVDHIKAHSKIIKSVEKEHINGEMVMFILATG